jgi:hypothetical protein
MKGFFLNTQLAASKPTSTQQPNAFLALIFLIPHRGFGDVI